MNLTKEQVQVVIDNLTKAKAMAAKTGVACPVDMGTASIHPCGTPMCHGGYYAMVKGLESDNILYPIVYSDGANEMAKDLGFGSMYSLQEWADDNPDIWGNEEGWNMFSDGNAFGSESDEIEDLQVIIDHWRGVQERLPA